MVSAAQSILILSYLSSTFAQRYANWFVSRCFRLTAAAVSNELKSENVFHSALRMSLEEGPSKVMKNGYIPATRGSSLLVVEQKLLFVVSKLKIEVCLC